MKKMQDKERELLRKQLELLAEQSKDAMLEEMPCLTTAMCEVCKELERHFCIATFSAGFLIMSANLIICFMVQIKKLFRSEAR